MPRAPSRSAGSRERCSAVLLATGCSVIGPRSLKQSRLQYNEVVKVTSEEEMLLNIVRLRYVDTPSSLQISNIAAQFELLNSLQLTPFFVASGAEPNRTFTSVLPQASIGGADRPTFSLTPLDESEFAKKLFTPLALDGVIYLVKTTWPISTVFRLYLENLNWVPNAQLASGPTPRVAPPHSEFLEGINALQVLQDRAQIVFALEDRSETPRRAAARRECHRIERDRRGQGRQRDSARPGRADLVALQESPTARHAH